MIKILNDITEYSGWIEDLCCDPSFSTPFCDWERVLAVSKKENHVLLGAFDGTVLTGIFCLLILEEETYIETVCLYSREKQAYKDLMDYLSNRYQRYEMWFVYNPKNFILQSFLREKRAFFYTEQRYMEYHGDKTGDIGEIIPYCDSYREDYIRIHSKDCYWDGEKVLADGTNFRIYLGIRDQKPVGYIDLSRGSDVTEVMDLLVLPEYRNQGIGALLLKKAVFLCRDHRLILTVDIDNAPAVHLYEKTGFEEIPANNCITAKLVL